MDFIPIKQELQDAITYAEENAKRYAANCAHAIEQAEEWRLASEHFKARAEQYRAIIAKLD